MAWYIQISIIHLKSFKPRGLLAACSAVGLSWQCGLPGCLASVAATGTWLRIRFVVEKNLKKIVV